jgi:hypothetical protein
LKKKDILRRGGEFAAFQLTTIIILWFILVKEDLRKGGEVENEKRSRC